MNGTNASRLASATAVASGTPGFDFAPQAASATIKSVETLAMITSSSRLHRSTALPEVAKEHEAVAERVLDAALARAPLLILDAGAVVLVVLGEQGLLVGLDLVDLDPDRAARRAV